MSNPMEQFVIKPIIPLKVGDVDISFTNSALFMVLAVVVSTVLLGLCLRRLQYCSHGCTIYSRKHL